MGLGSIFSILFKTLTSLSAIADKASFVFLRTSVSRFKLFSLSSFLLSAAFILIQIAYISPYDISFFGAGSAFLREPPPPPIGLHIGQAPGESPWGQV